MYVLYILPQLKKQKTQNIARASLTETWKCLVFREGCGEEGGSRGRAGPVWSLDLGVQGLLLLLRVRPRGGVHRGAFLLSFFSQPDCKATLSSGRGLEGDITI